MKEMNDFKSGQDDHYMMDCERVLPSFHHFNLNSQVTPQSFQFPSSPGKLWMRVTLAVAGQVRLHKPHQASRMPSIRVSFGHLEFKRFQKEASISLCIQFSFTIMAAVSKTKTLQHFGISSPKIPGLRKINLLQMMRHKITPHRRFTLFYLAHVGNLGDTRGGFVGHHTNPQEAPKIELQQVS